MAIHEIISKLNAGLVLSVFAVLTGWFVKGVSWEILSALFVLSFVVGVVQVRYQQLDPELRRVSKALAQTAAPALALAPFIVLATWGGYRFIPLLF